MSWAEMITNIIQGLGKFIIEILHYCAWPAAVLIALWWLRKPIVEAIGRFREFRHKDTVLGFDPAQLQGEFTDSVNLEDEIEQTPTWDHYVNALETAAIFCGVYVLRETDINRVKATLSKSVFDDLIKKIQKYRPGKFRLDQLDDFKKAVDALGLDETT